MVNQHKHKKTDVNIRQVIDDLEKFQSKIYFSFENPNIQENVQKYLSANYGLILQGLMAYRDIPETQRAEMQGLYNELSEAPVCSSFHGFDSKALEKVLNKNYSGDVGWFDLLMMQEALEFSKYVADTSGMEVHDLDKIKSQKRVIDLEKNLINRFKMGSHFIDDIAIIYKYVDFECKE